MKAYLIQIDARDSAGDPLSMRFSSHDDAALCHYDGETWWPAIAQLPSISYDFFDGGFRGDIGNPSGSFSLSMQAYPDMASAIWSDASFSLYQMDFDSSAITNLRALFSGRIRSQPRFSAGRAEIDFESDDRWLDEVLLDTYAGTGGLEGPDELEGTVKPLLLGAPRFAPGVLIDAVNNVYQLSAYGAIEAVEAAYDRLSCLGASSGDHADLTALLAASIANGSWATCLALGLVRLGAPPDGQVCFHVRGDAVGGWSRVPGALVNRIATIAGGTVASTSLSTINSTRPYNLSLAIVDQITPRELIQSIASSVKAVAGVNWAGELFLAPIAITSAVKTLNSDGTALPPVADVTQLPVDPPFWRLATEAEKTWVVHGSADIAYQYNFRGAYSEERVYRLDDVVSVDDGSTWRFIGDDPVAGSVPSDENTDWERRSAATDIHAIGGNIITHASEDAPGFPEFSINGTGDRHVDLEGRRYVQMSVEEGTITVDGEALTIGGEVLVQGWRRVDPVARIGGAYGLTIQNSSGDNTVDSDLLNNYQRTVSYGEEVAIDADANGTILTQFPLEIPITAFLGNTNVSSDADFSIILPAGIDGEINNTPGSANRGKLLINSFEAQGPIQIKVQFADGLIQRKELNIPLRFGTAPVGGGAGSSSVKDLSWDNVSTDSYVQITDDPLVVQSDASGNLKFRFYSTYTGNNGAEITAVARYRESGGSWSDAATEKVGSPVEVVPPVNYGFEPEPGYTNPGYINQPEITKAVGLSSTDYEVALFAKRSDGTGTVVFNSSNNIFSVKQ
jgi:hypothetical protein